MKVITKKNNPQFDIIRWLALAAGKDHALKPDLCYINIREDKATAVNGHVLNQYNYPNGMHQMFDLPVGLWEVVKLTKAEVQLQPSDETFPDTDSVWPDTDNFTRLDLCGHDPKGPKGSYNLARDFTVIIRGISSKVALNYDLFKIAAENAEMTTALVNPEGESAVVLQDGELRESLVMPIRMKSN